jgi:aspartate carbamoyltransferase catalytic subunit
MRHPETGAAARAATVSAVPIINAGDGSGEHPTQALLDIFTIYEAKPEKFAEQSQYVIARSEATKQSLAMNANQKSGECGSNGSSEQLKIAFVGDLKFGRTVHSLSQALAHFNASFYFISPPSLKMPREIIDQLRQNEVEIYEAENWNHIARTIDVLYMTRVQAERFTSSQEYERLKLSYVLNKKTAALFRPDCLFMHPLPRVGEIDPSLDNDPRSIYFQEAHNGVWMRMALLLRVFDKEA